MLRICYATCIMSSISFQVCSFRVWLAGNSFTNDFLCESCLCLPISVWGKNSQWGKKETPFPCSFKLTWPRSNGLKYCMQYQRFFQDLVHPISCCSPLFSAGFRGFFKIYIQISCCSPLFSAGFRGSTKLDFNTSRNALPTNLQD